MHWALSLIGMPRSKTIDALGRAEPPNYNNLGAYAQNGRGYFLQRGYSPSYCRLTFVL